MTNLRVDYIILFKSEVGHVVCHPGLLQVPQAIRLLSLTAICNTMPLLYRIKRAWSVVRVEPL